MPYPVKNSTVMKLAQMSPVDQKRTKHIVLYAPWRKHVVNKSGKTDKIAIQLYGYIVGWFMPKPSTKGGADAAPHQRFSGEMLELSYPEIEEELEIPHKQAQRGFRLLDELHLIKRYQTKTDAGTRFHVDLIYDQLVRISQPKTPDGWMQAALGAESWQPTEIRHWKRTVTERLALELLQTLCGANFVQPELYLAQLDELGIENVIRICAKMHLEPDSFEEIENPPGFIRGAVEQGKTDLIKYQISWVKSQLERIQGNDI